MNWKESVSMIKNSIKSKVFANIKYMKRNLSNLLQLFLATCSGRVASCSFLSISYEFCGIAGLKGMESHETLWLSFPPTWTRFSWHGGSVRAGPGLFHKPAETELAVNGREMRRTEIYQAENNPRIRAPFWKSRPRGLIDFCFALSPGRWRFRRTPVFCHPLLVYIFNNRNIFYL